MTFRPTCLQQVMARPPAMDEPIATSQATFSLGAHSTYTSGYLTMLSVISVLGVPG